MNSHKDIFRQQTLESANILNYIQQKNQNNDSQLQIYNMSKISKIEKILKAFEEFGYEPDAKLNKQKTIRLLNDITIANSSVGKLQPHLLQEIWEQGSQGLKFITIKKLAQVISEGLKSLKEQHDIIEKKIHQTTSLDQRKQLLLELYSVSNYYESLAMPFKIQKITQSPLIYESLKMVPEIIKNKQKYIFSFQATSQTTGLKIILWIAMLLIGLQVIMMFHKQHFYTLLCLCMVISIFMLNYFDAKYIRFLVGNLFFSTFLDLIWQISNAKRYWDKQGDDFICFQHSNILRFSTMFVMVIAVGKLMIAGILFKYRNNPANFQINMQFLQLNFCLNADPKNNPISKIL